MLYVTFENVLFVVIGMGTDDLPPSGDVAQALRKDVMSYRG
jgi:hypothetical protein